MGLRLVYLIVTRAVSLLGLSRRESWWKDAEILMLRHQLALAQRERPRAHARLTWPDRAWLALVVQQATNLLMDLDDAGMSVKFVLHDRDASFTAAFDAVFQAAGARLDRSAVQAPDERDHGTLHRQLPA